MSSYNLEFAYDTLPSFCLIGEIYEIKLCIVHSLTKGIGRKLETLFLDSFLTSLSFSLDSFLTSLDLFLSFVCLFVNL